MEGRGKATSDGFRVAWRRARLLAAVVQTPTRLLTECSTSAMATSRRRSRRNHCVSMGRGSRQSWRTPSRSDAASSPAKRTRFSSCAPNPGPSALCSESRRDAGWARTVTPPVRLGGGRLCGKGCALPRRLSPQLLSLSLPLSLSRPVCSSQTLGRVRTCLPRECNLQ